LGNAVEDWEKRFNLFLDRYGYKPDGDDRWGLRECLFTKHFIGEKKHLDLFCFFRQIPWLVKIYDYDGRCIEAYNAKTPAGLISRIKKTGCLSYE
jgi:hypothetical protein